MNRKLALIAAFSALLALTGCGGGSDNNSTPTPQVYDAPQLVKTDTTVGTGAEAVVNKTVTVNYTLYLYDSTKADSKGTKMQGPAPLTSVLANGSLISGFVQGVTGMKVGGKRTIIIPSSLAYGANPPAGSGIPVNSGVVFDVELTAVN